MRTLFLSAVLVACSSTTQVQNDAASDVTTPDAAADAGAGCDDAGTGSVSFQIQYPGEGPRSVCLPLALGVGLYYFPPADGGAKCTTLEDTNATGHVPDNSMLLNVVALNRELFADAGATTVGLNWYDHTVCADAGTCPTGFASATEKCAFEVDVAGSVGSVVSGKLTAPCTLSAVPSGATPSSVQFLSLSVEGPVTQVCP